MFFWPEGWKDETMDIKKLDDSARSRWDAFVKTCPEAGFFHLSGWQQILEKAFGHESHYLYAEQDGEIHGILPLAHVNSLLFGNALISTPFCVYGGVASNFLAARQALEHAASDLAHRLGVGHLELRNVYPSGSERLHQTLYVCFKKELDADLGKNLLEIPRKQRAIVRKGITCGLTGVEDPDIERFYQAYAESVRNLGTPVFSKYYFQLLKEVFKEDCQLLCVEHKGRVVSGVMSFYFHDQVLPYYGGGTKEARALHANDYMYWEVMRRSVERGVKLFDYGRSKMDSGSYHFKTHWGFKPTPLHYEYELINAKTMPQVNPQNPKYKLFIETWKHLPLPVSKLVGPWLSRNLG